MMTTEFLRADGSDSEAVSRAAEILRSGGIVAIPTETVYGLAGNALDAETVKKIYRAKGRPSDNPLIVHIAKIQDWRPLVEEIPERAMALAERFWPGPLTVILKKSAVIPDEICGGLDTVAVRMPSDKIAAAIIEKSGVPLAAPSANTSGRPSPTSARHVAEDLSGKIDAIVDGGVCSVGIESTVISLAGDRPRLLRPGGITPQMLREVLGEIEIDHGVFASLAEDEKAASPGMKYKHYAPSAEVFLIRGSLERYREYIRNNQREGDIALCFTGEEKELSVPFVTYGKKDSPEDQARHLFDALRKIDEMGGKRVFARFPESEGVGLGVYNRMLRAAAFKIIEV